MSLASELQFIYWLDQHFAISFIFSWIADRNDRIGVVRRLWIDYEIDTILRIVIIGMGQGKSNPFQPQGKLMSEFTILKQVPQLFSTNLKHNKTGQQFLLRQLTFNELRQFSLTAEKLKSYKTVKHANLTNLQTVEERTEDHMCSNFYKIYALWQYPIRTLAEEINKRAQLKKRFENGQMWHILGSVVAGMAALQQNNLKHQCLTARACLFDQLGYLKVADSLALGQQSNFQTIYNNRSQKGIYLSPEQCKSMDTQRPILKKNTYKNDVFTMGMIALQCGLLENQDQCYVEDCAKINWQRVQANLYKFTDIYEPDLSTFVQSMLVLEINARPDWLTLQKYTKRDSQQVSNNDSKDSRGIQEKNNGKSARNIQGESTKQPVVYAGQQPTFTKYFGNVPGALSMIPSVSNEGGSSIYSQRHSNIPQVHINPSNVFQTSYSNVSSIPQNSYVSQVGASLAATTYHPPSEGGIRTNPTRITHPHQSITFTTSSNQYQPFLPTNSAMPQPSNISSSLPSKLQTGLHPPKSHFSVQGIRFVPPISQKQDFTATFGRQSSGSQPVSIPLSPRDNRQSAPPHFSFKPDSHQKSKLIPVSSPNNFNIPASIEFVTSSPHLASIVQPSESINYEASKTSPSPPVNESPPNYAHPSELKLQTPQRPNEERDVNSQYVQEHFKLGSRYEGYKLNGMRHGKGKFFYQDGGSYQGDWKENKMNGKGTLYYQSNSKAYEGEWLDDKFHGWGTLYNEKPAPLPKGFDYTNFDEIDDYWEFYQGHFEEDQKSGKGKLQFSNGEAFEGNFKDDMVEGDGVFSCSNGRKVHGLWQQNHLVHLRT